jgi:uncharacterized protein (TIGR02453 family)
MPKFTGFPPQTLKFLKELERNNNREWFRANKSRYEDAVLEPALANVRERIATRPGEWKKARDARGFKSTFEFGGQSLKRPPRGYSEDSPHLEDLKRKDFIASADFAATEINDPAFVSTVARTYRKANLFMQFLCTAHEVEF